MGDNKLLTISIAAYNVEKYLEDTLQSLICRKDILEQMEVIIVDDGSMDKTSFIAQKYVDMYPDTFVLIKKENGGHGSTLNVASSCARGKYFRMLDGDDWYKTEELEKYVEELSKVDVDCVITPYCKVYNDRKICIDEHRWENRKEYSLQEIIETSREKDIWKQIYAPEITIKTCLLQEKEFRLLEKCMYVDKEYDLFVALYSKSFMKLPYEIYQYRLEINGQSVSNEGRKKYLNDSLKVVLAMVDTINKNKKEIISPNHKHYLYLYIRSTADFFCEGLSFLINESKRDAYLSDFEKKLKCSDEKFANIFIESAEYRWWNWLFSLRETLEQKKCVIFGAGQYGKRILQYLKNIDNEPEAFIDNNMQMWDTEKYGCMVESPSQLLSKYSQDQIIISVKNYTEQIEEQLLSMGVSPDRIIVFRK